MKKKINTEDNLPTTSQKTWTTIDSKRIFYAGVGFANWWCWVEYITIPLISKSPFISPTTTPIAFQNIYCNIFYFHTEEEGAWFNCNHIVPACPSMLKLQITSGLQRDKAGFPFEIVVQICRGEPYLNIWEVQACLHWTLCCIQSQRSRVKSRFLSYALAWWGADTMKSVLAAAS